MATSEGWAKGFKEIKYLHQIGINIEFSEENPCRCGATKAHQLNIRCLSPEDAEKVMKSLEHRAAKEKDDLLR